MLRVISTPSTLLKIPGFLWNYFFLILEKPIADWENLFSLPKRIFGYFPGNVEEESWLWRATKILEESQAGKVAKSRKTPSVLLSSVANSFQDNPA
jgi:hypothetical protein